MEDLSVEVRNGWRCKKLKYRVIGG